MSIEKLPLSGFGQDLQVAESELQTLVFQASACAFLIKVVFLQKKMRRRQRNFDGTKCAADRFIQHKKD